MAGNADTATGRRAHRATDTGRAPALPAPDALDEDQNLKTRRLLLSSDRLGLTAEIDIVEAADAAGVPVDASADLVSEGAAHYSESCAHCHGASGHEPAEWSRGMRPEPPHLTEAATEWAPEEIHWIVSNGIRMPGIPAFGSHHSPGEIVALTASVSALPGLSADDYEALGGSGG